jgi:HEAT repeat protein
VSEILTLKKTGILPSMMRGRSALMIFLGLIIGLNAVSTDEASAKRRRKSKKKKVVESSLDPEVIKGAKSVFTALAGTSNGQARLAVVQGLIELGGADREEGLTQAEKASDFDVKLAGLREVLAKPKVHKARYKKAKSEVEKLFLSGKTDEHQAGEKLVTGFYKKRALKALWTKALKRGGSAAQQAARQHYISMGGKAAWRVIKSSLKLKEETDGYKLALQALRDQQYPQAKSWALSHAGIKGEVGEVAQLWISRVSGKEAAKITKGLYKEYLKAAGNRKRKADFPRRVRLANMLSKRGMINQVLDTLAVAVKNKKGRVDADLDSAKIRVMGWEGLRACRDHEILKKVKDMMIELQNREEASPATLWLADWVKDTRDSFALQILEEMVEQPRYISRLEAIKALGSLKSRQSRPRILEALRNGDDDLRLAAAEALTLMAEPGDEAEFHKFLNRERKSLAVKEALLRGVLKIGTQETEKTIRFHLSKPEPELRRLAIKGLLSLKPNLKDLEKYLNFKRRNDREIDIRFTVWQALLSAGSDQLNRQFKSAAQWLEPQHLKGLAKDEKVSTEFYRVMTLQGSEELSFTSMDIFESRGESAKEDLIHIFKESSEAKLTARALSLLTDIVKEAGLDFYRKGLSSRDPEVRAVAFNAMRRFAPKSSLEEVRTAMENERKPHPRAEAARAYIAVSQRK